MRRKAQGFTLIEIMVVIAIIAGLIGTVAIIVPQMQEKQKRFTCTNNLSQLGQSFIVQAAEKSGRPKHDGSALWLSYRANTSLIKKGQESILVCPGDGSIIMPDTQADRDRYDGIDLKNPPNDLCSYAARDFTAHPLKVESASVQVIGCDRNGADGKTTHHPNGLNIVFNDGSCRFVEREELGISTNADIVVGPDATAEWLKEVVGVKVRKD